LRTTSDESLVLSWHPASRRDPTWPGSIFDARELNGFPVEAALQSDMASVGEWVSRQEWAQPLAEVSDRVRAALFTARLAAQRRRTASDQYKEAVAAAFRTGATYAELIWSAVCQGSRPHRPVVD
jgi:hypothetical protein